MVLYSSGLLFGRQWSRAYSDKRLATTVYKDNSITFWSDMSILLLIRHSFYLQETYRLWFGLRKEEVSHGGERGSFPAPVVAISSVPMTPRQWARLTVLPSSQTQRKGRFQALQRPRCTGGSVDVAEEPASLGSPNVPLVRDRIYSSATAWVTHPLYVA